MAVALLAWVEWIINSVLHHNEGPVPVFRNGIFFVPYLHLKNAAMKHFTWCLLLLCQSTLGQTINNQSGTANENVSGNPYLFKDWCNGTVRFTSGRVMNQFKLKFDVYKNQLLLQFNGSAFAAESKIEEFVMYPARSKSKDSLVFRKGFPPTDKTSEQTFYQVLYKDKVQLLRLFFRNIIEEKRLVVTSGSLDRHLEEGEYYYLLYNNSLILLPADRAELVAKFPDNQEQLTDFIAKQQLKMRNPEDFVSVVKKYNELIP